MNHHRSLPGGRHERLPMVGAPDATGTIRHCRHCWGDCRGECLLDETGICIHGANSRLPWPMRARSVLSRRWWRRILWGWVP